MKRPALVEELRTELEEVLVDGLLPQSQLGELKKMDSFMRECSRFNPFGFSTYNRPHIFLGLGY